MKYLIISLSFLAQSLVAQDSLRQKTLFKKPIVIMTDFGVLIGKNYGGYMAKASVSIQNFTGIQIRPKLALGTTVGLDWFNTVQVVPVSIGARGLLGKGLKKTRLFYALDAGYGFTFLSSKTEYETVTGGVSYSPALGLRIKMANNNAMLMSVGWRRQITYSSVSYPDPSTQVGRSFLPYYGGNDSETTKFFNRIAIKIGFSF